MSRKLSALAQALHIINNFHTPRAGVRAGQAAIEFPQQVACPDIIGAVGISAFTDLLVAWCFFRKLAFQDSVTELFQLHWGQIGDHYGYRVQETNKFCKVARLHELCACKKRLRKRDQLWRRLIGA
ncbi:MAG: hypothetical protein JW384_00983 [Nitrosomonadaceae bacterium]|nr:hypothetical protein [Nitrosomonadaceae bacterium]